MRRKRKKERKREEVREWTRVGSETPSLMTGRDRAIVCLSVVRMIQRHPWECNLFWLPVSPIFTCPFYNPPPHQRDWLMEIRIQHHTAKHIPERKPTSFLPLFSTPREPNRKGGATSRVGVMDISRRDMETQSVTDISIIEIFHRLLPSLWWWQKETNIQCCVVADGNWDKVGKITILLIQALSLFSSWYNICVSSVSVFFSVAEPPRLSISVSVFAAWGLCRNNRHCWYKSPPSALRCSTCHSPAERSEHVRCHGWSCGEALYGYVMRLVFREEKGRRGERG